jgi:hypothetical protein
MEKKTRNGRFNVKNTLERLETKSLDPNETKFEILPDFKDSKSGHGTKSLNYRIQQAESPQYSQECVYFPQITAKQAGETLIETPESGLYRKGKLNLK